MKAKPGHWWRVQDACVHSAKLHRLGDKAFRNWFNLNCVASAHGGVLPDIGTIAFDLRMSEARAAALLAELVAARLFDQRDDGKFVPHDYNDWQFKTDDIDATNADRQKKFRAKQKRELAELRALLANNVTALRNSVTDVTAKRADTDKNITTTENVERGLSEGNVTKRPSEVSGRELAEIYARKGTG